MKTISGQIEKLFIKIAFAEERKIVHLGNRPGRLGGWFHNLFTAITFAEAGEFDTARDLMGGDSGNSRRRSGSHFTGFCASRAW